MVMRGSDDLRNSRDPIDSRRIRHCSQRTLQIYNLITLAFERLSAENLIAINYPNNKIINIHFMTLYSLKLKRIYIYIYY